MTDGTETATARSEFRVTPRKWDIDVSILGQPLMMVGFVKIFAIAGLVMWALLAFIMAVQGDMKAIVGLTQLVGAVLAGLTVLSILVMVLVLRNRMSMRYHLDDEGITAEMIDSRVKTTQTLAIVLGALAGKPGAVGAGLTSRSQNVERTVWGAVTKVRRHEGGRVVALSNAWRTIMYVFVREADWPKVAEEIETAVARDRAKVLPDARGNPVPRLLLLTLGTIVASIPFFVLPREVGNDIFAAIFVLAFAVTSIWLLPVFAWVTWAGIAWICGRALIFGALPYHSQFGGGEYPQFQLMSDNDWAVLIFAALGIAWHVWLGRRLLTGLEESALAGDEIRMAGDGTVPKRRRRGGKG